MRLWPGPVLEPMKEDQDGIRLGNYMLSLAGPKPVHMDEESRHSLPKVIMKILDDTFNFGDQFLHDKPTEDEQEKSKVREESDSTIPDSSHQTATSTPPVIAPFTEVSSSKPSSFNGHSPPIKQEATTIPTSLPENHSILRSSVRVENWSKRCLENKLDNALHKSHEYVEVCQQILQPIRLYHALMEAFDSGNNDERRHGLEVEDMVKDHNEKSMIVMMMKMMMMMTALSAGSNQGRSTKRRRSGFCRFWITDTRDAGADSSMHKSDPESEHSEQSSDDISKQDEGI
ncbi:hypothetical protein Tco_0132487 [Tanacetum coccineum]